MSQRTTARLGWSLLELCLVLFGRERDPSLFPEIHGILMIPRLPATTE
jgi:hypothetical protein